MRLHHWLAPAVVLALFTVPLAAADLPKVEKVDLQPLAAQAKRIADTLDFVGSPLPEADRKALEAAKSPADVQAVLDKHCLAAVTAAGQKEPLQVVAGPAKPELAEQGWRVFLVKVVNPTGLSKLELRPDSPNAQPMLKGSTSSPAPTVMSLDEVKKRFLELMSFNNQPLTRDLSGLELEYRVLQVYCRDAGRKEAALGFSLVGDVVEKVKGPDGKETERTVRKAVATGAPIPFLFESAPAVVVKLKVQDDDGQSQRDGKPIMAAFTFRDSQGRVYPSQSRRLAPDFFFHAQVCRADGQTILLQPGKYSVTWPRGPEYLIQKREITGPAAATHSES